MNLLKSIITISFLVSLFIWVGCNDSNNPTEPPPPAKPVTLTAAQLTTAPSITDVNDPAWNAITPVTIPLNSFSFAKQSRDLYSSTQSVPKTLEAQAAVTDSFLFIRLSWADATHNVWPNRFVVTGFDPNIGLTLFQQDNSAAIEDQVMVMFKNIDSTKTWDWDVWQWRALTTDAGNLAEGFNLQGTSLIRDIGTTELFYTNAIGTIEPILMNPGGGANTDPRLFRQSADSLDRDSSLWSVGDLLPGWQIDSLVTTAIGFSRFDINAASSYSIADGYSVVLSGKLRGIENDDFDLLDSTQVPIRIAISNNLNFKLTSGDSNQGFSSEFILFLK